MDMNLGFKVALTCFLLTIAFAAIGELRSTHELFKGWWVFFSWMTFIGFVVGGIMEIWKKK